MNSTVFNLRNFWGIGLRESFYKENASPVAFYIYRRKAPSFTLIIRPDNI